MNEGEAILPLSLSRRRLLSVAGLACFGAGAALAADAPEKTALTIVIVRHGEKPEQGDNLSCQGLNRALALPPVLMKFGHPNLAYVPALKQGDSTAHARMFQTVTPTAVQLTLTVNSQYAEDDVVERSDR